MPSKRLIKRPRGRPPKDPAHRARYRQATVRLREDGGVVKPAVRVNPTEVEAWLVAHAAEFWHGRGRPPSGQRTWASAAMQRFDISRSTLLRVVKAINRRRERASATASAGMTPAQASLLAALAQSYRNTVPGNVSGIARENVSGQINRSQIDGPSRITSITVGRGASPLSPEIHPADVREAVVGSLRASSDLAFLHQVQDVIESRLAAMGHHKPKPLAATPPGARGMEALGLRVVVQPQRASLPVKPPVDAITESLLEALDAAEAMGKLPSATLGLLRQIRHQLGG